MIDIAIEVAKALAIGAVLGVGLFIFFIVVSKILEEIFY